MQADEWASLDGFFEFYRFFIAFQQLRQPRFSTTAIKRICSQREREMAVSVVPPKSWLNSNQIPTGF